jgi:hypothetical protein
VPDRQAADRSVLWNPDSHRAFGYVRPDLLLVGDFGRIRLPIDAKYKDYDGEKLQPADIYQAAIYALALARSTVPGRLRTCVLLHPSRSQHTLVRQRVQVRVGDTGTAEIVAVGLPVAELLNNLRSARTAALMAGTWYSVIAELLVSEGTAA